eukprot:3044064-Rhodomonas_salina.2
MSLSSKALRQLAASASRGVPVFERSVVCRKAILSALSLAIHTRAWPLLAAPRRLLASESALWLPGPCPISFSLFNSKVCIRSRPFVVIAAATAPESRHSLRGRADQTQPELAHTGTAAAEH